MNILQNFRVSGLSDKYLLTFINQFKNCYNLQNSNKRLIQTGLLSLIHVFFNKYFFYF